VVTDATKKLREPVAYMLLAFAGLLALASLIRLFVGGAGFTAAAGTVQGVVTPPSISGLVILLVLVGAVWLVNETERTPNARTVTLAALVIVGVTALIGLITAFAGFNETSTAGMKIVGFIYALGGLALYGAAGLYILKTFQALPAPVRAPKPGQFQQQGQQYGQTAPYGQQGYPQQGQQGYQQQGQQYGGQYDQGQGQYGGYAAAGAAGGYPAGQGEQQQWPQEQSWGQGEQQAWSAGEAEAQHSAQHSAGQEQAWTAEGQGAEPTQPWSSEGQQQWGQDAGQQAQQWPQEQQWGGAEAGQQQWGGQEYGQAQPAQSVQPGQQEWGQQEHPVTEEGSHEQSEAQPQAWQQEQAWQAEETPAAEQPPSAAEPAQTEPADETRVDPRVEPDKNDPNQQGQGQQGWWSPPS
jgi:hypothetical protein